MENSCSVKENILEESQKWVRGNKGLLVKKEGYDSPRISSEIPDCSMPLSFDHLSYCSLGCLYCFAYFFKSNNPKYIGKTVQLNSVSLKKIEGALTGKGTNRRGKLLWKHFYSKKFLFHWGGLADPFCYFEKKNGTGLRLIKLLGAHNYPTLFSFKGPAIEKDSCVKVFQKYSKQKNFAFQISMVTGDDDMAKMVEIGVPSPTRRIGYIKMLSDMGYFTILRLRPYIIGITDKSIEGLLERCLEAGIKGVSMEFMAIDNRSNAGMKERYSAIANLIGVENLQKYFSVLSPSERGGYLRLNRLVKEPYVKQVYRFCKENDLIFGCSDPDYKELNTSGSCCAMPDKYPANPLLENWTRSQSTFHLKKARETYHKTGEQVVLKFRDVYGNESYLDEPDFVIDNVEVVGRCWADRKAMTQRSLLQTRWNNLNSAGNPRNYYHGKLLPIGVDDDGNLEYIYNPMEYEKRWVEEGIKLT